MQQRGGKIALLFANGCTHRFVSQGSIRLKHGGRSDGPPWTGTRISRNLCLVACQTPLLTLYPLTQPSRSNTAMIEENDPVIEGGGPRFVTDSVMENARIVPWKADVSVMATETPYPFHGYYPLSLAP